MQPIERYGVIALLFLVITVIAVVLWDKEAPADASAGQFLAANEVRAADRDRARPTERRTLPTVVEPRPFVGRAAASEGSLAGRLEQGSKRATPEKKRGSSLAETLRSVSESALATVSEREPKPRVRGRDPYAPMTRNKPAIETAREIPTEPRREEKTKSTRVKPEPRAAAASQGVYVVASGDTLSGIAQKTLGKASRWKEIADLNGNLDPRRMVVGMKLELPRGAKVEAAKEKASKPAPTRSGDYRIQNGDSLWKIAARELGDGERWREIAALNPKLDANRLVVGRSIALPEGRKSSPASLQLAAADRPRGRVR